MFMYIRAQRAIRQRDQCRPIHVLYFAISCSVLYLTVSVSYPKFTYRADVEDKWRLTAGGYYSNWIPGDMSRRLMSKNGSTVAVDFCPVWPPGLGDAEDRINLRIDPPTMNEISEHNPRVLPGGLSYPEECVALQKVAVIITYRDRWTHLLHLLARLHTLLQRQQCHYRIYVAEQVSAGDFNKGRLYNAGFVMAMKTGDWDCVILHDVDLVPETDDNLYRCADVPIHMSAGVDTLRYTLMYKELIGGVLSMTPDHYRRINGFSNEYWGWGGEDDDMEIRMQKVRLGVLHTSTQNGRYKMVPHTQRRPSIHRYRYLVNNDTWVTDGLSNLAFLNITITAMHKHAMYTNITIDAGIESGAVETTTVA